MMDMNELNTFIVRAKVATPCRLGSHDLHLSDGQWSCHDSYFGGSDCIGAEAFHGREIIRRGEEIAYELLYHGGLIRD